jgi:hypothetical protein
LYKRKAGWQLKEVPTPPFSEYNISSRVKNIKKKADKRRIFSRNGVNEGKRPPRKLAASIF